MLREEVAEEIEEINEGALVVVQSELVSLLSILYPSRGKGAGSFFLSCIDQTSGHRRRIGHDISHV